MSGWQYAKHIFEIYYRVQRFLLMVGETFNLWKTPFEYAEIKIYSTSLSETQAISNTGES